MRLSKAMANQTPRTLAVIGPRGAGKATVIGNMIYKCNGISTLTMMKFEEQGISTYDRVLEALESLDVDPSFETPKHVFNVLRANMKQSDYVVIVTAADAPLPPNAWLDIDIQNSIVAGQKLIVLVNKMDTVDWSMERFNVIVHDLTRYLENLGMNAQRIPFIPVCGLSGDNLIELSIKSPWYTGLAQSISTEGKGGTTLLESLDDS